MIHHPELVSLRKADKTGQAIWGMSVLLRFTTILEATAPRRTSPHVPSSRTSATNEDNPNTGDGISCPVLVVTWGDALGRIQLPTSLTIIAASVTCPFIPALASRDVDLYMGATCMWFRSGLGMQSQPSTASCRPENYDPSGDSSPLYLRSLLDIHMMHSMSYIPHVSQASRCPKG